VIRFSAGLVVVAIGVLIGGVATSKLSLVYIAIAVSACALVALAIGVVLKRDELFGGGPELAPAGAGAGSSAPGQSASAGHARESAGHVRGSQEQILPNVPVASQSAPFPGPAATPVAPLSAAAPVSANPLSADPPLAPHRPAYGQAPMREADSAAGWQTRSPQAPWSAADLVRPTWTPKEPTPKAPVAAALPVPMPSASRAGAGVAPPSWFDRLNQPAAKTDRAEDGEDGHNTVTSADLAGVSVPAATQAPAAATDAVVDDDDDWPTRYSWLEDDETDEPAAGDKSAAPDDPDEVDEVDAVVPEPADAQASATGGDEPVAAEAGPPDGLTSADAEDADAGRDKPAETETEDDETPAEAPLVSEADSEADEAGDESSVGQEDDPMLVTVVPGVPRYHEPNCILIRFMDEDDVQKRSIPEAKAAKCTPCVACQPPG
jgi:hypothetical protein